MEDDLLPETLRALSAAGRLACELDEAKSKIKRYEKALTRIKTRLICVGGPLNDNADQFTKKQRGLFWEIIEDIEATEGE